MKLNGVKPGGGGGGVHLRTPRSNGHYWIAMALFCGDTKICFPKVTILVHYEAPINMKYLNPQDPEQTLIYLLAL